MPIAKSHVLRLTLIFVIFCFVLTASFAKAEYVVGVKNGDWMRYDVNVTYLGQTFQGSLRLTVQDVQGTLINGTFELTSGGQSIVPTEQYTLDVSTGVGQSANGFILPANLTVGNFIPGESANVSTVADWQGRKAIVANASTPYLGFMSQVYWDQATGVLLETRGSVSGSDFSIVLAETSLWTSGFSYVWFIVIVVVAVVVALTILTLLLRRRKGLTPPSSAQEMAPPPPPPS